MEKRVVVNFASKKMLIVTDTPIKEWKQEESGQKN
jgi:hypothetical protein